MKVRMRGSTPGWVCGRGTFSPSQTSVSVLCRCVVERPDHGCSVVSLSSLDRVIRSQSKSDGGVEVVRLPGGAEGALKARRWQRPGIAANGILAKYRVGLFCIRIICGLRPFSHATGHIVNAPR